jgi:pre-mRNA-processing factor 17
VSKTRPLDKRKRKRNGDPSDIEGYLGPWAKYEDEETVSKPGEEDAEYLEEYLSKMNRRGKKQQDEKSIDETTKLHIKDAYDYQNRSFLHIPQDVGVNLKGMELNHIRIKKYIVLVKS